MSTRTPVRAFLTVLAFLGTSALGTMVGVPSADATPTVAKASATPRIPGVYYQIRARHSGKCLDVTGASLADGTQVIQYHCINNHANQQWDLTRNYLGYYQIRVRHSGKCLDVTGASTADSVRVIQYRCHGGTNQQWRLTRNSAGYYQIQARHSGKCLDIEGASTADGARAIQYHCHGGTNQQFEFIGDFG